MRRRGLHSRRARCPSYSRLSRLGVTQPRYRRHGLHACCRMLLLLRSRRAPLLPPPPQPPLCGATHWSWPWCEEARERAKERAGRTGSALATRPASSAGAAPVVGATLAAGPAPPTPPATRLEPAMDEEGKSGKKAHLLCVAAAAACTPPPAYVNCAPPLLSSSSRRTRVATARTHRLHVPPPVHTNRRAGPSSRSAAPCYRPRPPPARLARHRPRPPLTPEVLAPNPATTAPDPQHIRPDPREPPPGL